PYGFSSISILHVVEQAILHQFEWMLFSLNFHKELGGARTRTVQNPSRLDPYTPMRADGHAAVEAGEAVGAVEFDGSPLGVEAVDPVVAAEGVGEADGDEVEAAGVCGVGEVALEGELFHDGVADEFFVEEDLCAEAGAADVEEDAF